MFTSTVAKSKMENAQSLTEKGEQMPENVELFKNFVNAQKALIEQQKMLIDWLAGQVVSTNLSPTATKVPKSLKYFLKDRPTQFWLAGLLLAVMSISSLVLFFSLYDYNPPTPAPPTFGHDDNLGDDIQIINRKQWEGVAPVNVTKLTHPLKMVRIMHTGGSNCNDMKNCAYKVRRLQGWQIATKGMPDLSYNYMIGGDGNVYVGRGPDVMNEKRHDAIDVGYIGNFLTPYDQMTDKMEEAGKRLIAKLRKEGYITPDYIVVAQNHTISTWSPGQNIYKRLIHWPHYDSGIYFQ